VVSNDTIRKGQILTEENKRIESEKEVQTYIQNLRYALKNGTIFQFQGQRLVDEKRNIRFTNEFTIRDLFPNENPTDSLKRELLSLTKENYIQTVKDLRFPNRSEMREFGKIYNEKDDVYIKIRVELLNEFGNMTTFVMSFHYAEISFTPDIFPYKK